MSRTLLMGTVLATLWTSGACAEDNPAAKKDDPVARELADAKDAYRAAVKTAKDRVLAAIAEEDTAVTDDPKLKPAEKLQRLDQLAAEKKAFETDGTVPKNPKLKKAVDAYQKEIKPAREACEKAFDTAADKYLRTDRKAAKAVLDAKQEFFKDTATPASVKPDPKTTDLLKDDSLAAWNVTATLARHWSLKGGVLRFDGAGKEEFNLATKRTFRNFKLQCEWKIGPGGDSGIFLRGTPQVQIWDRARSKDARFGSGGLHNNTTQPKNPSEPADKPVGEWNSMTIRMLGDKVTVELNGVTVVDGVRMENSPDPKRALPATGPVVLQAWGTPVEFRKLVIEELPN